jgi:hypothetical protein
MVAGSTFGAPLPGYLILAPSAWGGGTIGYALSVPWTVIDGAYAVGLIFCDPGAGTRIYKNNLAAITQTGGGCQGSVTIPLL